MGYLVPKNTANIPVKTFNSLYGILQPFNSFLFILYLSIPFMGYWNSRILSLILEFSFNSLYGILCLNFSHWRCFSILSIPFMWYLIWLNEQLKKVRKCFQFPLWDTLSHLTNNHKFLETFNSLYGIHARVIFRFVFGYPRGTFYLIINPILGL